MTRGAVGDKKMEKGEAMGPSGLGAGEGACVSVCAWTERLCGLEGPLRTEGWGNRSVTWEIGSVSSWFSGSRSKGYLLKCASASQVLFLGTNHQKY